MLAGGLTWREVREILEEKVAYFNRPEFIENDPISVPHAFEMKQDIEIAGLFAAIFAWGQRKTAIGKARTLMQLMGHEPHRFVLEAGKRDLDDLERFRHRTFGGQDTVFFMQGLNRLYSRYGSMEDIFLHRSVKEGLTELNRIFFQEDATHRSQRHLSNPERKSSCKRLNMFLRWMVRSDARGVDFGLWTALSPASLICPLDVHVGRTSRELGLLARPQDDWLAAEELTANLRLLDPADPVKYDFALFGLGLERKGKAMRIQ
jgi:uncharacterized protein (TIGR02757 family)